MQEAEANLKQAAVDFLAAAAEVADRTGQADADALDAVETDVPDLGDLEPAITPEELAELRSRLERERLLPATLVELIALARQVATTLLDG